MQPILLAYEAPFGSFFEFIKEPYSSRLLKVGSASVQGLPQRFFRITTNTFLLKMSGKQKHGLDMGAMEIQRGELNRTDFYLSPRYTTPAQYTLSNYL